MIPELGMRRRALSSGLFARDQVTCAMQASAKGRDHQHSTEKLRCSPEGVKCDISRARPGSKGGWAADRRAINLPIENSAKLALAHMMKADGRRCGWGPIRAALVRSIAQALIS